MMIIGTLYRAHSEGQQFIKKFVNEVKIQILGFRNKI